MSLKQEINLQRFHSLLEGRTLGRDNPIFDAVVSFLKNLPGKLPIDEEKKIRRQVCSTFGIDNVELDSAIAVFPTEMPAVEISRKELDNAQQIEADLNSLAPSSGFIRRYIEFTRNCEPPIAYHIYTALAGIGAVVNRRVRLSMGYFNVYPTLGVIILGPSGLKKTSATDIMVGMLQEAQLVKIYSEKLTPEALIEAMGGDNATGLVYAPEMAVFLSKQKYMEGIVPLLTRFMDCPDVWESGTIMRGNKVLRNVAISCLMCSTPDWFISNTPEDMFGGGFIARNLLIVQHTSPRIFPIPKPADPTERQSLIELLGYIHSIEGEMQLTGACLKMYEDWYRQSKETSKNPEHEMLETYFQRKPTHALRIAMSLHLARCGGLELCTTCFEQSFQLLNYMERFLPSLLESMFKSQSGLESDLVLRKIRSKGGQITHSELVQRLQYKMDAARIRNIISSLKESGDVDEEKGLGAGRIYRLTKRSLNGKN